MIVFDLRYSYSIYIDKANVILYKVFHKSAPPVHGHAPSEAQFATSIDA